MSDEQRARFEAWWQNYLKTCQRFSTGGTDFALCDSTESIAWQAWQAANMAQNIAAQIEGGGWPRTD